MKSLVNLLLILFICISCSKEEDNEYEPYIEGSIVGYAMLTDQYGNLLDDHSGITVYTEPGRKYAGKTDAKGRFEIKGVPTGTYNLSFEKAGFGSMMYPEIHHLGGKPTLLGIPTTTNPWRDRIVLHEEIALQITSMTIYQGNRIKIEVPHSAPPMLDNLYLYSRLFFSTSDGFAIKDAEYIANTRIYDTGGYFDDLPELPFESGTTVYCKGMLFTSGASIRLADGSYAQAIDNYYDETLDMTVYPNITEESDQYAFIIP